MMVGQLWVFISTELGGDVPLFFSKFTGHDSVTSCLLWNCALMCLVLLSSPSHCVISCPFSVLTCVLFVNQHCVYLICGLPDVLVSSSCVPPCSSCFFSCVSPPFHQGLSIVFQCLPVSPCGMLLLYLGPSCLNWVVFCSSGLFFV